MIVIKLVLKKQVSKLFSMRNLSFSPLICFMLSITGLICLLISSDTATAKPEKIIKQISYLENDFKSIMYDYYQDRSSYTADSLQTIPSIDLLYSEIIWRIESNQQETAIQLIHYNIKTIKKNIKKNTIVKFIKVLLNYNDWKLANKLFSASAKNGENKHIALMQFYFANYDAKNSNWSQVYRRLKNNLNKIDIKHYDYAHLLYGSSLMHHNKHKLAINIFDKIPSTSRYYIYAQLNTAIAKTRISQWTGIIDKMTNIINDPSKTNNDLNRLHLLLGYTLFQRERFDDAINIFMRIKINSQYANKALLGIGLSEIKHERYDGGLFYLNLLKSKKIIDLSVDESYLIISYLYEKQQQGVAAAVSYEGAINYYNKRLNQLNKILQLKNNVSSIDFETETSSIIIGNNSFDYGKHFPDSFMLNYEKLKKISAKSKNKHLKINIEKTLTKYRFVLKSITRYLIEQRKTYLESYISQTRYGLANYYDNSKF